MEPLHNPYRHAILHVLPLELKDKLAKAEEQFRVYLLETAGLKGKADDWIRSGELQNHFEHLDAELETEHTQRLHHFQAILAKQIKVLLEEWKDCEEE